MKTLLPIGQLFRSEYGGQGKVTSNLAQKSQSWKRRPVLHKERARPAALSAFERGRCFMH